MDLITYFVDEHWHIPLIQESPWDAKHSVLLAQPAPYDFFTSHIEFADQ